jgi:hypothetical protein
MSFPCVPSVATLARTVVDAGAAPAGRAIRAAAVAAMTMELIERARRIWFLLVRASRTLNDREVREAVTQEQGKKG